MDKHLKTVKKPANNLSKPTDYAEIPMKNLGGRPRKEQPTRKDAQEKTRLEHVKRYLEAHPDCTFSGMGRALGFSSGLEFIKEAKKNKDSKALHLALSMVEERYENNLQGRNATGAIFALKQVGWADTQRVEAEINGLDINIALSQSVEEISQKLSEGCETRN